MRSLQLVVRGQVQGVGFRAYVLRMARECGVNGEVRNMPDGSVEAVAEGDVPSLVAFAAAVRRGTEHTRVESFESRAAQGPARYDGFSISK